jgi:phosphotransferase system enzyme I (PtsI)
VQRGADGIGLYRTEFLFLSHQGDPDEDDHLAAYRAVVGDMPGRPIVIRTFDLGADKVRVHADADEQNPSLGLRSIRLSLRDLDLFRRQLRAVLRASVEGDVRVMFPLVSTIQELRQAKMVLADVMEDLEEQGVGFNRKLPVGIMVEVPSTAVAIEHFAREVDFLSIGTNDLIQYTLAVDRGSLQVAGLYSAADPAVLRLVAQVVQAGEVAGVPVDLCGQMSGNPRYTMLLLGLGLRQLSVAPAAIPEIKRVCRRVRLDECRRVSQRALEMDSARDIEAYLGQELLRVLPELGDD